MLRGPYHHFSFLQMWITGRPLCSWIAHFKNAISMGPLTNIPKVPELGDRGLKIFFLAIFTKVIWSILWCVVSCSLLFLTWTSQVQGQKCSFENFTECSETVGFLCTYFKIFLCSYYPVTCSNISWVTYVSICPQFSTSRNGGRQLSSCLAG